MPDIYTSVTSEASPKYMAPVENAFNKELSQSKSWWKEVIAGVLRGVGETPRKARWGSYMVLPSHHFVTQQEDEEVVLMLRAHPVTNFKWVVTAIVMLILPTLLENLGVFNAIPFKFLFIGKLTWYLATLMFSVEQFMHWYYSVFIVTNERLVDIDFVNLMFRVITYANLNHIEEPAMVTGGIFRSLFQYGDVFVTTASEKPTIEALGVPWPQRVVDIISRLSEELEKKRERGE
jgi:membrane protein YdbS with pleckstrin-like domain